MSLNIKNNFAKRKDDPAEREDNSVKEKSAQTGTTRPTAIWR